MADYDSPWKEALELYFERFLAFFFPRIHADIDWDRECEFLDKELQEVMREGAFGRGVVDKLVKVWLKNGEETWLLIHIEIQSQYEADFGSRMFVYNYRLFDVYNRTVVSLAILGDDRPNWRPRRFGYRQWGCIVHFQFPVAKLLDYADDVAALEANPNPFATVVLAHLKTMETHGNPAARQGWMIRLGRNLFKLGLSREQIWQLFRLIDWMMELPQALHDPVLDEMGRLQQEKENLMPFISGLERRAIERGQQEGLREGLLRGIEGMLEIKFGSQGQGILQEIREVTEIELLESIRRAIPTATSLDELRQLMSN